LLFNLYAFFVFAYSFQFSAFPVFCAVVFKMASNGLQVGVCSPVLRLRQGYYAYLRLAVVPVAQLTKNSGKIQKRSKVRGFSNIKFTSCKDEKTYNPK
jgi:hypothetical protein